MADTNWNFLNYEGLEYYDSKSEVRTDEKIAVETERAKKAEKNNATSINNEVARATNAENTLTANLSSHTSNKSNPHGVTKAQVGLGNVDNTSDANKPISTATQTALNAKAPLASPTLTGTPKAPTASAGTNTTQIATTAFVQTAVSNLVDSAPETLNTLNELSAALGDDPNFATTIATQLGNKVDKVDGKGLSTNDYTTTEKTKLSGIATGAEVNQNTFSNVKVGSTTIAADSKTDTLTLVGSNVTLTPDATNDKVTIGITSENITSALGYTPSINDTTYGVATTSSNGLMSKEDKSKLDGIISKRATVGQSSSTTTNPWYKFASLTETSAHTDNSITFKVTTGYNDNNTSVGILTAHFRTGQTKIWESGQLVWEYAGSGIDVNDFVIAYKNTADTSCAVELWVKIDEAYVHKQFEVISENSRTNSINKWTLYKTSSAGSASAITSGYTQIVSTLGSIKNSTSGNASTATKLATARTIDGVSFNGTAAITHYGTCSTEAATVAKTVALTGFTLVTGARVLVKFTVTNTAASPTLNVNSTGAKAIMYRGSAISAGYLAANRVYEFVYDGTDWELIGDINTDTKVTNNLATTTKAYITGTTSSSTNTGTQVFDTGVYLDTIAGQLTATTFKGNLSGNATTATTANSLAKISLTGGDDKTTGYRLIGSSSISAWGNNRMIFAISSRHTGNGIISITYGCNNATISADNCYCQINYWGNTSTSDNLISSDSFQCYVSSDSTMMYFFWKYNDYNTAYITPLSNSGGFTISNGTWMTSISSTTYGTLKASTTINSSSSCTGNSATATTATKVGTATVGSATQPVYINAGVPTKCTYTLGKSVPSNAKFTDTTYTLNYDKDSSELQLKTGDSVVSSVTITGGSPLKIVTWADGTYDEIKAMLDAHYAGTIDISDYWAVGDVRTIPISAISATGVGESQSAQNAEVAIIGFGHDDLVTSVNGNSKSAVSLQLKNSLATVGYMYSEYNSPSYSLWDGSPRRTWCNSVFKNALPAELANLIKTVTKKTWRYAYSDYRDYRTQQTTNDDCFLVSEFEVFGTQGLSSSGYGTVGEDGTQYEYYKTTANRIKYLGVSGTSTNYWWLRSSFVNNYGYSHFRRVHASGSVGGNDANSTYGVAPGFCI